MSVNTNSKFKEESRKRFNQPIYLYTLFDYDGAGHNLYYASYDIDVVFDGVTYSKFPITHSDISENTKGEIDSTTIQVANVSRLIEAYLQNYDLRGKKVSVKLVFANQLDDPDCFVEFSGNIDSYSSNVSDVVFNIMTKFDVLNVTIPGMVYLRDICQWIYKSEECASTSELTTCNKTWEDCKARNNSKRFIGFRSIPGRRGYT